MLRNKLIYILDKQRMSTFSANFHFGVNYTYGSLKKKKLTSNEKHSASLSLYLWIKDYYPSHLWLIWLKCLEYISLNNGNLLPLTVNCMKPNAGLFWAPSWRAALEIIQWNINKTLPSHEFTHEHTDIWKSHMCIGLYRIFSLDVYIIQMM